MATNPPEWANSKRCPACAALNDAAAEWCGQCMTKFPGARPVDYETAVRRALRAGETAERNQRAADSAPARSKLPQAAPASGLVPAESAEGGDAAAGDDAAPGFSVTYQVETAEQAQTAGNGSQGLLSKVSSEFGLLPMQHARDETDSFSLAFKIEKGALSWTCSNCGNENPIREESCGLCGTPFKKVARHFADKNTQRRQRMTALDTAGTLVAFSPLGLPLRLLALGLSALGRVFLRRPRS